MSRNKYCCDCGTIHAELVEHVKTEMLEDKEFDTVEKYFKALGDRTRIRIVWALFNHEMCVCDLSNLLSMSISSISHQLRELKLCKLIKSRRDGKTIYYSLFDRHVENFVNNALEHIMEDRDEVKD